MPSTFSVASSVDRSRLFFSAGFFWRASITRCELLILLRISKPPPACTFFICWASWIASFSVSTLSAYRWRSDVYELLLRLLDSLPWTGVQVFDELCATRRATSSERHNLQQIDGEKKRWHCWSSLRIRTWRNISRTYPVRATLPFRNGISIENSTHSWSGPLSNVEFTDTPWDDTASSHTIRIFSGDWKYWKVPHSGKGLAQYLVSKFPRVPFRHEFRYFFIENICQLWIITVALEGHWITFW